MSGTASEPSSTPEGTSPFRHLTVIGLGLIGGSFAMAARERFPELKIRAVDTRAEALQYAVKHKIIDQPSLVIPDFYEPKHLVVLASHLSDTMTALPEIARHVQGQDVLVTDVGSCKRAITALGIELLPEQFIAGHPMAGKEFSGIENATSLLFAGKSYLFCPHEGTPPDRLAALTGFIRDLGGVPRLIDPERHDRYMAYVSHLPQLYSLLLTNLLYEHEPGHLLTYHGGGLDDQLRLAASPYAMWRDVFEQNGDNLHHVLTELQHIIRQAAPLLGEQGEGFAPWFARSNEVHQEFHALKMSRVQDPSL